MRILSVPFLLLKALDTSPMMVVGDQTKRIVNEGRTIPSTPLQLVQSLSCVSFRTYAALVWNLNASTVYFKPRTCATNLTNSWRTMESPANTIFVLLSAETASKAEKTPSLHTLGTQIPSTKFPSESLDFLQRLGFESGSFHPEGYTTVPDFHNTQRVVVPSPHTLDLYGHLTAHPFRLQSTPTNAGLEDVLGFGSAHQLVLSVLIDPHFWG